MSPLNAAVAAQTIPLPAGFRAHSGAAGLREHGDDVFVVVNNGPSAASSAVFTRSLFAGPSVQLSRENAAGGHARGVVVVAKNANVATGEEGMADAREVLERAARAVGVAPEELLIASTGVIGRRYPMPMLRTHLDGLAGAEFDADALALATAMMTTDTHPKTAVVEMTTTTGGTARVVGIAKGVGMIEPDMATMIAVIFTDAAVEPAELDAAFRGAVDQTFNCLSIDTDTSTSDTAIALASGVAGPVDQAELRRAFAAVCLDLTRQLARDGEGATKLLTVEVTGARDREQAKRVAKAILNSPLVKTAVHGADPNWGRVAMAIGKCHEDTDIDPERVRIVFGDLETYPAFPGPAELERLTEIMRAEEVTISVDLGVIESGAGTGECTVYGCDLTREYISINADYTT
ncbi:bifunctional glutamate N-acetyltransferase/amino-acid acetyltransferase ArgJ [Rhodococcus sp. IEGM 1408]|uniref:bifunctional glutamate N-acetyltransferase/amino-acid acetyltransferase ArgJ n=1 Tax=Rhodococcus sp. IEGM 1408 TaxID=3082220 RepID=UPI002952D20A|nr:bifunctional glutamate N-acetyltransferase/amino-acid acetyltransferase ArgJ [Rhodococcus sp. IEGM 1408]MDV7999717.1 bifunctional glutamate N-acetyltransferase/amino-acid acetyltransferase ArgJ [Rhodococcus sp. IEGM 1408]